MEICGGCVLPFVLSVPLVRPPDCQLSFKAEQFRCTRVACTASLLVVVCTTTPAVESNRSLSLHLSL